MKKRTLSLVAVAIAASCTLGLTGCSSSYPKIAGVWTPSDGTTTKTISDDGNCTNLLYRNKAMYETDNPGMCHILEAASNGAYVFQVNQEPYSVKYSAVFSDNDTKISLSLKGKQFLTLTRVAGSH